MTRKSTIVRFNNMQGHALTGRLDMQDDREPFAFGVFVPCFTCTKDSLAASRICRQLADKNIAMLRFDHAGLGESAGDFYDTTTSVRIEDIISACIFLEDNYKAPSFIVGHSIGGTLAFAAADRSPEIKMIATIGSPRDTRYLAQKFIKNGQAIFFEDRMELMAAGQRLKFRRDFIDDMRKHDIASSMSLFPGKTLVFHAPSDNIVSFDNANEIYTRASGDKKLIRLDPKASHMLERPEDTAQVATVIFDAVLRP